MEGCLCGNSERVSFISKFYNLYHISYQQNHDYVLAVSAFRKRFQIHSGVDQKRDTFHWVVLKQISNFEKGDLNYP